MTHASTAQPGPSGTVRVVLATTRASLLCEVVARMVNRAPGFCCGPVVVGDPGSVDVADPDVVLAEVAGDGGRAHLESLKRRWPATPVLMMVEAGGPWCGRLAGDVGAAGWVPTSIGEAELLAAIGDATRLGRLRPAPARPPAGDGDALRLGQLSARERQVLDLLGAGRRLADIAGSLGISPHTVRTHVQNVITKLDVHSRLEAVALARRSGSLDVDLRDSDGGSHPHRRPSPAHLAG